MDIVYLNGDYLPLAEAKISPMDRGFLFADGVYEVIPCFQGRPLGFQLHLERMRDGLAAIEIQLDWSDARWRELCEQLLDRNGGGNLAIYLQVSRGVDRVRQHAYPRDIQPTVFGFTMAIPAPPAADQAVTYSVTTAADQRWQHCHIKSTALLGNVMHFNQGYRGGHHETILYNAAGELTEASASNVYVVKGGRVATPPLQGQILAGVTRALLLQILRAEGSIPVAERAVLLTELRDADEVWLSSSTRNVAPVTSIDGQPVADGQVGKLWHRAQELFVRHRYDYE